MTKNTLRSSTKRHRKRIRTQHLKGLIGIAIVVTILLIAVLAPFITQHQPTVPNLTARLTPPAWQEGGSWSHPLGTDSLGRDIWSRIAFGSRISLLVGLASVTVAGLLGVTLGVVSGYFGGWIDHIIMRAADVQLAFPFLLLAIFVIAVLGPNTFNLIAVLSFSGWVTYARLARAGALSLREQEYVVASKVAGAVDSHMILRHIIPNTLPIVFAIITYQVGQMILAEASLSFLGLGVPPPTPTWGGIVAEGREYINIAWWVITFPGIALMLTVIGFGFIGDWLRDRSDPMLRK